VNYQYVEAMEWNSNHIYALYDDDNDDDNDDNNDDNDNHDDV
jgi:hypothetical protein